MFMVKGFFKKQFNGFDYADFSKKKTVNFLCHKEYKQGVIIGECYKYEGVFEEGCKHIPFQQDYEPNRLVDRKRVNFWQVLIAFNSIALVKKTDFTLLETINRNETK